MKQVLIRKGEVVVEEVPAPLEGVHSTSTCMVQEQKERSQSD